MFKQSTDKKIPERLARYVDPTGELSNRDLRLGEWYITHRIMLREIVVGILVGIIVIFGGYSLYRVIEYAFFGYTHDERVRSDLARTTIPLSNLRAAVSARPLVIDSVAVYPSTPGKTDFVAMAENQNDRWVAHVTYSFSWDGGETSPATSVVLPGTTLPLAIVGVPQASEPSGVLLNIKKTDWERLDNHVFVDPAKFVRDHTDFAAEDLVFTPAAGGASISQIKFNLKNNSAFGYWQAPFMVLLKKGDSVVGIKKFIVDSLNTGEARAIELTSLVDSLDVDGVELFVDLDILDQTNFLPPKAV